ncbi:MAG: dephospho-CoA kinase [Candidatus Omnitrophica bacterium]|nr:dephospho-CoA kinase [Candidatus Omnitrophota bacterium]
MKVIGLTGSLASGKTTAAAIFAQQGAVILDADTMAHRALFRGSTCYAALVRAFGTGIRRADGRIDRARLAAAVFGNQRRYRRLCAIVYPWLAGAVRKRLARLRRRRAAVVVIDAAMLLEAGLSAVVDCVVLMRGDPAQQVRRAAARRGWTPQQARERLRRQWPYAKKKKYADMIIDNRGSRRQLVASVRRVWKQVCHCRAGASP